LYVLARIISIQIRHIARLGKIFSAPGKTSSSASWNVQFQELYLGNFVFSGEGIDFCGLDLDLVLVSKPAPQTRVGRRIEFE
jgi:hypothetical protein